MYKLVQISMRMALFISWSQIRVSMAMFTTKLLIPSRSLQFLQERGHSQKSIEDIFSHCLILKLKSSYNDSITCGLGGGTTYIPLLQ